MRQRARHRRLPAARRPPQEHRPPRHQRTLRQPQGLPTRSRQTRQHAAGRRNVPQRRRQVQSVLRPQRPPQLVGGGAIAAVRALDHRRTVRAPANPHPAPARQAQRHAGCTVGEFRPCRQRGRRQRHRRPCIWPFDIQQGLPQFLWIGRRGHRPTQRLPRRFRHRLHQVVRRNRKHRLRPDLRQRQPRRVPQRQPVNQRPRRNPVPHGPAQLGVPAQLAGHTHQPLHD